MSTFNVEQFMTQKHSGELATEYVNVPEDEYPAMVAQVDKPVVGTRPDGESFISFQVHWNISTPEVNKLTGRDRNLVRQSVFLDTDEKGKLDSSPGRNVKLGQLLEAVGLHGKPWSADDLMGKTAMVRVSHVPNKKDPSAPPYANVTATAPLG